MTKTQEKNSDSLPCQGRLGICHFRPFPPIWISAVLVSQTLTSFLPAAPSLTFLPLLDLHRVPAPGSFVSLCSFLPALSPCSPLALQMSISTGALSSTLTLSVSPTALRTHPWVEALCHFAQCCLKPNGASLKNEQTHIGSLDTHRLFLLIDLLETQASSCVSSSLPKPNHHVSDPTDKFFHVFLISYPSPDPT